MRFQKYPDSCERDLKPVCRAISKQYGFCDWFTDFVSTEGQFVSKSMRCSIRIRVDVAYARTIEWNSDFSNHLRKSKLVRIIGRVSKITVLDWWYSRAVWIESNSREFRKTEGSRNRDSSTRIYPFTNSASPLELRISPSATSSYTNTSFKCNSYICMRFQTWIDSDLGYP